LQEQEHHETANIYVLVVEDTIQDAELISEMLGEVTEPRFIFSHAPLLSNGLAFLEEQRFDIVLLDLGLPDSQGIETVQKVHEKAPDVPIIVLTGMQDEELAVKALQMEVTTARTKKGTLVRPSGART
jgi:DNA-binding response OmpR family regulator